LSSVARVAAGATWTSRTTSVPWGPREFHTSVIDAAGAIYVIGGYSGRTSFHDVWVSTDGGAGRTQMVLGDTGGTWGYYWRGSWVYPRGTEVHSRGTQRASRDTEGFRKRHPRHRRGLPWGTRGTLGGTLGMYSVEYYAEPPVLQRHLTGVLNGYSCALFHRSDHRSVARVGRRRDVDMRDRQRAVGCTIWAHVRDRRRRRHLRHRRHRQHRLQRRVGEHRRRCGPDLRGVARGVLGGYYEGTACVLRGYNGVLLGYRRSSQGVLEGMLYGTKGGRKGFTRGTRGVL
jgi:hypothetical protein